MLPPASDSFATCCLGPPPSHLPSLSSPSHCDSNLPRHRAFNTVASQQSSHRHRNHYCAPTALLLPPPPVGPPSHLTLLQHMLRLTRSMRVKQEEMQDTAPAATLAEDLDKTGARICKHMNEDHAGSILAYAHHFAKMPMAKAATLTGLTPEGFLLTVEGEYNTIENVLVRYTVPLTSAGQIRKLAVAMHFEAFHGMGLMYKIKTGFYQDSIKQAYTHIPSKVLFPGLLALAGIAAASAIGYSSKPNMSQ